MGPNYSYRTLSYTDLVTGEVSERNMAHFMDHIAEDMISRAGRNPILLIYPSFFGKEIFPVDTRYFTNCRNLRNFIREIIVEKKQNKDTDDIVSLLCQDENYTPEEVVDDMIVMFLAGTKTVQTNITNFITTMLFEPEIYTKMRAEMDPLMARVKDDILGKMTLEEVDELEYTKLCFLEALRRNSPVASSITSCMLKDITVGGVFLRKDDPFLI